MIETIIFFGIGIIALYFAYRHMRKEFVSGKCAGCPYSKNCPSKSCCESKDKKLCH